MGRVGDGSGERATMDATERVRVLEAMAQGPLDLLVIGGGITGAGILWDATLRGLRAGLVEMQDFGAGTSSRSTKLIHGGLRYLEQYDFALVREVGRERAVVYRLAPHLVQPVPMLLPFVRGSRHGPMAVRLGTWLYDRLADVKPAERRRMLNAAETRRREPLLRPDILGSALYYEYTTDDARLTLEVVQSAVAEGALAVNYARADDFVYGSGRRIRGAKVTDLVTGTQYTIEAHAVVNAAGPWADDLRARDASLDGHHLRLTKGVHIVFAEGRLPLREAVYFDHRDGRLIFAIPHGAVTYVGTTDTDYVGDPADPPVEEADVRYLLEAAQETFPGAALERGDVIASWAGVRPLIAQPGRSASQTSRRDEVLVSASGLISIAGGKLTGFRLMAQQAVDRVCSVLARDPSLPRCGRVRTSEVPLTGGRIAGGPEGLAALAHDAVRRGLPEEEADTLARRYGARLPEVLDAWEQARDLDVAVTRHAVHHEMAVHALDVLSRRTGWLLFAPGHARTAAHTVVATMGDLLGWDETRRAAEEQAVAQAYGKATLRLTAST